MSLFVELIMGENGRKLLGKRSKCSKFAQKSSKMSQNVPKCPKVSTSDASLSDRTFFPAWSCKQRWRNNVWYGGSYWFLANKTQDPGGEEAQRWQRVRLRPSPSLMWNAAACASLQSGAMFASISGGVPSISDKNPEHLSWSISQFLKIVTYDLSAVVTAIRNHGYR